MTAVITHVLIDGHGQIPKYVKPDRCGLLSLKAQRNLELYPEPGPGLRVLMSFLAEQPDAGTHKHPGELVPDQPKT